MVTQLRRLKNELRIFANRPDIHANIVPYSESDIMRLKGTFTGFEGSLYEKGVYEVEINITTLYPSKPPKAKFVTKVWHPNISSSTGCICLSLLNEDWRIDDNLASLVGAIKALLICAEPSDPQDAPVAAQYINRREMFDMTAAFWNYNYAGGERKDYFDEYETKIEELKSMNYGENQAIHALSMNNWNIQEALNHLQ